MKRHAKFLLLATLVMAILCVSAASAEDVNITDDEIALNVMDEPVEESSAEEVELEATAGEDVLADDENINAQLNLSYEENMVAGKTYTFNVSLPEDANNWIDVYLDDSDGLFTGIYLEDGKGSFQYTPHDMKPHELILHYYGNGKYAEMDYTYNVQAIDYTIEFEESTVEYSDLVHLYLVVPSFITQDITVSINGKEYTVKSEDYYCFDADNLVVGENEANIYFAGNDTVHEFNETQTITAVIKKDIEVNITIPEKRYAGEECTVTVKLPEDAGHQYYTLEYFEYDEYWDYSGDYECVNNELTVDTWPSFYQTKQYRFYYPGNDIYKSKYIYFNVTANDFKISPYEDHYPFSNIIELEFSNPIGKSFNVTINGKTYTTRHAVDVDNFKYGENEVNVYFEGDETYHEFNETYIIKVAGEIEYDTYFLYKSDYGYIELKLPEDASGKLILYSYDENDGEYTYTEILSADMENGYAKLDLTNMPVQKTDIFINYTDDDKYRVEGLYEILQINPIIDLQTVTFDKTILISVETSPNAKGNLTVYKSDDWYYDYFDELIFTEIMFIEMENDTMEFTLPIESDSIIMVKYQNGNHTYEISRRVRLAEMTLSLENNSDISNKNYFNVNLNRYYDCTAEFYFDEELKSTESLYGNTYTFYFDNCQLTPGNHTIEVCLTIGSYKTSQKITVTVEDIEMTLSLENNSEISIDEEYFNVYFSNACEGTLEFYFDEELKSTQTINGDTYTVYFNNRPLTPGNHTIEVNFTTTNNQKTSQKINVNVKPIEMTLSLENNSEISIDEEYFNVYFSKYCDGTLEFYFDEELKLADSLYSDTYTVYFNNCQLTPGNHTIEVNFTSTNNQKTSKKINVNIKPIEMTLSLENNSEISTYQGQNFLVTFNKKIYGQVTFYFDGMEKYSDYLYSEDIREIYFWDCELTPGNHTIEVNYTYGNIHLTEKINVIVVPISITIPTEISKNYEYLSTDSIRVYASSDASGEIIVYVDGEQYYTAQQLSGSTIYSFDLKELDVGYHDVEVVYSGDEKYNRTAKSERVHVDYVVNLAQNSIKYKTDQVRICIGNYDHPTIKIDDVEYEYTLDGHYATIPGDNITLGSHRVTVEDNEELLLDTNLYVYSSIIYNGEKEEISLILPEDANGNVTIKVSKRNPDTEEYEIFLTEEVGLTDGKMSYCLDLIPDYYLLKAYYTGDDYYPSEIYQYISTNYKFKLEDDEISVLENTTAIIKVNDQFSGEFYVKIYKIEGIFNYNYYAETSRTEIANNRAEITISGLEQGYYQLQLTFEGYLDGNEYGNAQYYYLNVTPLSTELSAVSENIIEGESAFVNITLPEGVTGNVTVEVDGKAIYTVTANQTMCIEIENLNEGIHGVKITFNGDPLYADNSTFVGIEVGRNYITPEMKLSVNDTVVCENPDAIVELPEDATGNVTLKVDGQIIETFTVENGTLVMEIMNLNVGTHYIETIYSGDGKFASKSEGKEITVSKIETELTVQDVEINEGETAEIEIGISENATGVILAEINGKKYYADISAGKATFSVEDLSADTYTAKITYGGDENYSNRTSQVEIKVNEIQAPETPKVTINIPDDIKPGDNAEIAIVLPENATGNVTVKVDGQEIASKELEGGMAAVNVDGLKEGTHIIEVTYTGDENYTGKTETMEITIEKVITTLSVEADEITEGDTLTITVTVNTASSSTGIRPGLLGANSPSDANGFVIVDINDDKYYGDVIEGRATVSIRNLKAGEYTADITYIGDDKYAKSTLTSPIKVKALEFEDAEINITVGDDVKVDLPEDATGNVTVKIDGKEITTTKVENGTANIPINELTTGEHIIEVTYTGDDKYSAKTETQEINIEKQTTSIKADPVEITEGETTTLNIEISESATGIVLINIGDARFYSEIKDGKATVNIENLKAGKYTATIIYNGDEKHNANTTTATVNVKAAEPAPEPVTPEINITVSDDVKVDLPEDATGNVTVKIDGKEITTTKVENGTANIPIDKLTTGEHIIEVTYTGDDKYSAKTETQEINIEKQSTTIKADPVEITEGETATLNIETTESATGIVLINIGDARFYSEIKDGKASVKIENFKAGKYTATVIYNGDEKYEANTTTAAVNVKAAEPAPEPVTPEIKVDVPSEVAPGDDVSVDVELPDDATGNVIVKVNDAEIANVPVKNGAVSVPVEDLSSGVNTVEVIYSGDENYAPATTAAAIYRAKLDTKITVDSKFSRVANDFNAGERGAFFYAILSDLNDNVLVNRTVQIAVNGPIYNVTTDEEGRAGLQVNLANANTYTYALSFTGDEDYNAAPLASSKLTVTKKTTSISASAKTFKASAKTKTIAVTLKVSKNPYDGKTYLSAGKKITLKVNGKTYSAKADSKGVAKITVKLTKKGTYTAKIAFGGDKTYKESSKTVKITIK